MEFASFIVLLQSRIPQHEAPIRESLVNNNVDKCGNGEGFVG